MAAQMRRTILHSLAALSVFAFSIYLFNSAQHSYSREKAPLVSVDFDDLTTNFSSIEVLKLEIVAHADATVMYILAPQHVTIRNMSKGETIELLMLTELETFPTEEKIVTSLHESGSGLRSITPIGGTGRQDVQEVKPFIEDVPEDGVYMLTEAGEELLVGAVLDKKRFIQLVGEGRIDATTIFDRGN